MSEKELKMICSNHKISYLKKEILKPSKNGFLMYDLIKKPCKHLNTKNFKCKDYLNVDKPKVCNDYPVFLINNYVMFASDCLAVQEGLLSKYEEEFKKINIKLI